MFQHAFFSSGAWSEQGIFLISYGHQNDANNSLKTFDDFYLLASHQKLSFSEAYQV